MEKGHNPPSPQDFAATIPFSLGAHEILTWFDAGPARQAVDEHFDPLADSIIRAYE
jgi:TRAP-type mannitol/chloroaromatic compound transport system substrate-binding protein